MPPSPFLEPNGWEIKSWTPGPQVPQGIPGNAFSQGDLLNITEPEPTVFSLQWTGQNEQTSSVSGLNSNEAQTELQGTNLSVSFAGRQAPVTCNLTVTLTSTDPNKTLSGTISLPPSLEGKSIAGEDVGPDVGSGTFTAEANPGGTVDARKH